MVKASFLQIVWIEMVKQLKNKSGPEDNISWDKAGFIDNKATISYM